jgi:hypothetical protein
VILDLLPRDDAVGIVIDEAGQRRHRPRAIRPRLHGDAIERIVGLADLGDDGATLRIRPPGQIQPRIVAGILRSPQVGRLQMNPRNLVRHGR